MTVKNAFARFARAVASAMGSPHAFVIALLAVVLWAAVGPLFGFSSEWQLVINTGTTIITFLVVFIIQSTQNKDAKAVHLKLDELIHVISKARNRLIDCEDLSDDELAKLDREFQQLRKREDRQSASS
ncbi:MAG TPA: low affinity iron permease family protein [Kofleriaceae bacterium]